MVAPASVLQSLIVIGSVVNLAFDIVKGIYRDRFGVIVQQGSFSAMIVCLTQFAINQRFPQISLKFIGTLKGTIPVMLACLECLLSHGLQLARHRM